MFLVWQCPLGVFRQEHNRHREYRDRRIHLRKVFKLRKSEIWYLFHLFSYERQDSLVSVTLENETDKKPSKTKRKLKKIKGPNPKLVLMNFAWKPFFKLCYYSSSPGCGKSFNSLTAQDYQVCITVIEARHLAGINMDPVVCVQVLWVFFIIFSQSLKVCFKLS